MQKEILEEKHNLLFSISRITKFFQTSENSSDHQAGMWHKYNLIQDAGPNNWNEGK